MIHFWQQEHMVGSYRSLKRAPGSKNGLYTYTEIREKLKDSKKYFCLYTSSMQKSLYPYHIFLGSCFCDCVLCLFAFYIQKEVFMSRKTDAGNTKRFLCVFDIQIYKMETILACFAFEFLFFSFPFDEDLLLACVSSPKNHEVL